MEATERLIIEATVATMRAYANMLEAMLTEHEAVAPDEQPVSPALEGDEDESYMLSHSDEWRQPRKIR